MTSLQAVSGAGRNGGVLSLDIIDNVIPYIPKEEEKVRREVCKSSARSQRLAWSRCRCASAPPARACP